MLPSLQYRDRGIHSAAAVLQVDGREYGLLRKTPQLAFGHCILYMWLQMMGSGGVKWWTFWRDALYAYSRCCQPVVKLLI